MVSRLVSSLSIALCQQMRTDVSPAKEAFVTLMTSDSFFMGNHSIFCPVCPVSLCHLVVLCLCAVFKFEFMFLFLFCS